MEKVTRLSDRCFTLNVFFIKQQAAYLLHDSYYIKVLKAEYNYIEKRNILFLLMKRKLSKGEKK